MHKDKEQIQQELARFDALRKNYLGKPFTIKRERVQEIENEIGDIVGTNPGYIKMDEHKDEIELLLGERRVLLNWMFKETKVEKDRMRVVNQRMYDLTNRLRVKMADVCANLVDHERDDFDDDFEVEGTLKFSYNGEDSILPYEGDDIYGSNFELMINVRDWLKSDDCCNQIELFCKYDDKRKSILENTFDDGQSWAHDIPAKFDGIIICHTTCQFVRDFGFPIVDFLHLNDFWSEVHLRYQNFATQDPNYSYPRD